MRKVFFIFITTKNAITFFARLVPVIRFALANLHGESCRKNNPCAPSKKKGLTSNLDYIFFPQIIRRYLISIAKFGIKQAVIFIVLLSLTSISYADNFADKFKRGVVNSLTGWLEIPRKIIDTSKEENLLKGLTIGLAKGLGRGVKRTAAGLCETTTFIMPFPKQNYETIMTPENVFIKDNHNQNN